MSKTNQNDSAFPYASFDTEGRMNECAEGVTKREYFAAMAMQSLIERLDLKPNNLATMRQIIATEAIAHADALIEQLNKAQ